MKLPILEQVLQVLDRRGPDGARLPPTPKVQQALGWLALAAYGIGDGPEATNNLLLELFVDAGILPEASPAEARTRLADHWRSHPIDPGLYQALQALAAQVASDHRAQPRSAPGERGALQ